MKKTEKLNFSDFIIKILFLTWLHLYVKGYKPFSPKKA